jgi:hypothetical protein
MEVEVGKITHYFGKIGVAAVQLTDTLKKDDLVIPLTSNKKSR